MAAEKLQVFWCETCGIVVSTVKGGGGVLSCCGKPMKLMVDNTTEAATEKHIPVAEKVDGGVKVTVGSVQHPMQDDHWIEWIELRTADKSYRQFLAPGDTPEVFFAVTEGVISVHAYCNLHGLWKVNL
jgi:superoxide reductase